MNLSRSLALAAAAAAALAAGCFRDHPADASQTFDERCLSCHLHDYQDTTAPVHEGRFPRTCDDCHRTVGWQPALEGLHPDSARFRIDRGPHHDVTCLECHDPDLGPSTAGANTTCTYCHAHRREESDDKHHEVGLYRWDDARPSFCLDCHPDGRGDD